MNIIDHISLGVPSIKEGTDFYTQLMNKMGYELLVANDSFAAYGKDSPQFLLMLPFDGNQYSNGNGAHIAFVAADRKQVDAFHSYAIEHGGTDEGKPGERPGYPKEDVYVSFVRDPFGNKLEAIYNGFNA